MARPARRLRPLLTAAGVAASTAVLALASACSGTSSQASSGAPTLLPQIHLNEASASAFAGTVDLTGLPTGDLSALRSSSFTQNEWIALLRISVEGSADEMRERPAVLGTYAVLADRVRFTPLFPFDAGRPYRVVFNPSVLAPRRGDDATAPWRSQSLEATVRADAGDAGDAGDIVERQPTTRIVRAYPTADEIPENQLRMYVQFSAPMAFKSGTEHVRLLDAAGTVVEGAFLPLDVGLWNADRTRYTLLFDPVRVKSGISPNETSGRAIAKGRSYTLVVDREWRDGRGAPLMEPFRRDLRVVAPVDHAIDPNEWKVVRPPPSTRDPLRVVFPRPMDYALLQRALIVLGPRGETVEGSVDVEAGETQWIFRPDEPWHAGDYRLTALSALEDPAGNRIGRPFEVPTEDASRYSKTASPHVMPFTIGTRHGSRH